MLFNNYLMICIKIGWYESSSSLDKDENSTPCIFTSVTPAWNNQNLTRLAEKIKSSLVFAHVRASTAGVLSETNCNSFFSYSIIRFINRI